MERAVFGTRTGEVIVGYGPFTAHADRPHAGVAFYKNDFSLSEAKPWLIPDRIEVLEKPPARGPIDIDWAEPDPAGFAEVFREVSGAIGRGIIEKSVPVVTAKGEGGVPEREMPSAPSCGTQCTPPSTLPASSPP